MNNSRNRFAASFFLILSAGLSSCESGPLDRPETKELASSPPLPRTVGVRVSCLEPDLFGTEREWDAALADCFRQLHVGAEVWMERDPGFQEADVVVEMSLIRNPNAQPPSIDAQAAFLNFLAWSTLPVLPWFFRDVQVDPGLEIQVSWTFQPRGEVLSGQKAWTCEPLLTSFHERYPLLSWQTPGALFLPPFVYREGNSKHLMGSVGKRLRTEAAVQVARTIKNARPQGEMMWNLRLEPGEILQFEADPDLGKIDLWVDGDSSERVTYSPEEDQAGANPWQISLRGLLKKDPSSGKLLRVEALSRDGRRLRYSLPLRLSTNG